MAHRGEGSAPIPGREAPGSAKPGGPGAKWADRVLDPWRERSDREGGPGARLE